MTFPLNFERMKIKIMLLKNAMYILFMIMNRAIQLARNSRYEFVAPLDEVLYR